ncbi:hypothetical protein EUGRSUZ_B01342 [Eucalyptus grandis]|uniref:Uncharacterized protein n=2 Tax=Eucalyptus grandis TaxID=71139 RepID=A0ACC3LRK2_EUCGR|nr:hypothetical protein EUGRSUZ_B01342 [Eucalyptus grandis]
MGIKGLTKLLADNAPNAMKEQKLESYFGRRIAVDASMSIYQFLVVVGRKGTQMLTNEVGEVTRFAGIVILHGNKIHFARVSHPQGMFYQTIRLLEAGIEAVYVFDGPPPDLKKQELAKRFLNRTDASEELAVAIASQNKEDIEKFSKGTVKHNEDCKRLLRLMDVPVVEAPSEAEAQGATLCKAGKVYAVASEDMDSLTFGTPIFLHHLMDPISRKVPVMEFEISKEMNLDMDQFVDLCILSGCDYCESIQGIGGLTALKLISQNGSIENILENINEQSEALLLFKGPIVSTEEQPEIKWTAPNEEGLISFLVNENGFNIDRVTNAIEKIKVAKDESSQGRLALKPKIFSTQVSVNPHPRVLGSFKMPTMVLGLRNFKQPLRIVCVPTWI